MPNYLRVTLPGASYFFTVVTKHRQAVLMDDNVRNALRAAIEQVRARFPFTINAWVLLPDHLHCIWTLPDGDADYAKRWSMIKRLTTQASGRNDLWQPRYWEHCLRDEGDLQQHLDYIHWNPAKHGLVAKAGDWPYSTFHRYVRAAYYPADWGIAGEVDGEFGE
jgi:putative transposase